MISCFVSISFNEADLLLKTAGKEIKQISEMRFQV